MPLPKVKAKAAPKAGDKKNPDFTATAENLCNPPAVKQLLEGLHGEQERLGKLKGDIPEGIRKDIEQSEKVIEDLTKDLKKAIEKSGSFQDIKAGLYAIRYRRIHKEYLAEPFAKQYEKLAPAVIINAVNVSVLEQLIKGGVVAEADLKAKGIIEEKTTYSFYIR